MPCGRDIIDALECVVSIYFSNVRHRNRAAFILCDELVEMTCKAKFRISHPKMGRIDFYTLLIDRAVNLDPNVVGSLGETLHRNHQTRNDMQHAIAAATVDDQHCADAILDAVHCMEHCFPGTMGIFVDGMRVGLRVVRLHSSHGTQRQRDLFENAMRAYKWNTPYKGAKSTELPILVGARPYWGHVIMANGAIVAQLLDQIGAV